jgi:transcriptional regulator with XRE-family HTH domain
MGAEYACDPYVCQAYVSGAMDCASRAFEHAAMETKAALGKALAKLRRTAKLTQEKLAELSGVQQTDISRIEGGTQGMTLETIQALAAALQVRVSQFWATAEEIQGGKQPAELPTAKRPSPQTQTEAAIDVLRHAVSVLFSATAFYRSGPEAKRIAARMRENLPEEIAGDEYLNSLLAALDKAAGTKARRGPL